MRVFLLWLSLMPLVAAQDLGTYGETFEISEADLLDVLQQKLSQLSREDLEKAQHQMAAQAQKKIEHPTPVSQMRKTVNPRTFTYDPTITVPFDLKDPQGRLFQAQGKRVNPLDYVRLSQPLVFINGEDTDQLEWALHHPTHPKIVLVRGAPLKLMEATGHRLYFDQGGKITQKLGIQQVPALVHQKGKVLEIQELVVPRGEGS